MWELRGLPKGAETLNKKSHLKNKHKKNNSSALALLTGEIITISGTRKNLQIDWHLNGRKNHTSLHGSLKTKAFRVHDQHFSQPLSRKKPQQIILWYDSWQVSGTVVIRTDYIKILSLLYFIYENAIFKLKTKSYSQNWSSWPEQGA